MRRFSLIALFVMLLAQAAWAGPLEDIAKAQKETSTVQASFAQEKHTELMSRPLRSKGTFYMKTSKGVRWQYADEMDVIFDGKVIYVYYTELNEVEKVMGAAGYAGPLVFDIKSIVKEYDVTESEAGGIYTLLLKPKSRMPFVQMQMAFQKGAAFPQSVTITEETGDRTVINFTSIEINKSLSDKFFKFTPAKGAKVRERQVQ